jgi:hypothetical protein
MHDEQDVVRHEVSRGVHTSDQMKGPPPSNAGDNAVVHQHCSGLSGGQPMIREYIGIDLREVGSRPTGSRR